MELIYLALSAYYALLRRFRQVVSSLKVNSELESSVFYKYHHATKHTVEKLMSYEHRMDWANQPDPFLRFSGSRKIDLPNDFQVSQDNYLEAIAKYAETAGLATAKTIEPPEPVSGLKFISNLLFYSTAVSAWKQVVGTEHRWALRVNASSGNLHPTDIHVLLKEDWDGLPAGFYHYRVDEHRLEERVTGDLVTPLLDFLQLDDSPPVVLCLSSIFFRESWKYRDRGFRYCQHDLGHALGALSLAASTLGWSSRIIGLFPDREIREYLGMDEWDGKPLAFMLLSPYSRPDALMEFHSPQSLFRNDDSKALPRNLFAGTANKLSGRIVTYDSIDQVYDSTSYDVAAFESARGQDNQIEAQPAALVLAREPEDLERSLLAVNLDCKDESVHKTIRLRRSAVDMDGVTGMERSHLESILRCATTGFPADFQGIDSVRDKIWQSSSESHLIKLYLYVHRVRNLESGLYFFDRIENQLAPLLLRDQRETAKGTSCFQDIACDGAFSISMIADFNRGFRLYRDRCYRLAHYEAGFIGQLLYLGARALGHDATGIGCFLDDAINNYLALPYGEEVIYNFTFGKAVHDPRLTTLPSYEFDYPDFQTI